MCYGPLLPDECAVLAAVRYVQQQSNPLLIWTIDEYRDTTGERGA